ncbi:hypothetical protein [Parabacteroides pacaensis]|uniref:hypothetical protein n=1 Tax=Parabacteroides pacaensis TaxID=2086575 RepID=UPI000D108EB0|nr:hypothetical protein [Parabacteroides pacaensis]
MTNFSSGAHSSTPAMATNDPSSPIFKVGFNDQGFRVKRGMTEIGAGCFWDTLLLVVFSFQLEMILLFELS